MLICFLGGGGSVLDPDPGGFKRTNFKRKNVRKSPTVKNGITNPIFYDNYVFWVDILE